LPDLLYYHWSVEHLEQGRLLRNQIFEPVQIILFYGNVRGCKHCPRICMAQHVALGYGAGAGSDAAQPIDVASCSSCSNLCFFLGCCRPAPVYAAPSATGKATDLVRIVAMPTAASTIHGTTRAGGSGSGGGIMCVSTKPLVDAAAAAGRTMSAAVWRN
jgi:hypothetical protein